MFTLILSGQRPAILTQTRAHEDIFPEGGPLSLLSGLLLSVNKATTGFTVWCLGSGSSRQLVIFCVCTLIKLPSGHVEMTSCLPWALKLGLGLVGPCPTVQVGWGRVCSVAFYYKWSCLSTPHPGDPGHRFLRAACRLPWGADGQIFVGWRRASEPLRVSFPVKGPKSGSGPSSEGPLHRQCWRCSLPGCCLVGTARSPCPCDPPGSLLYFGVTAHWGFSCSSEHIAPLILPAGSLCDRAGDSPSPLGAPEELCPGVENSVLGVNTERGSPARPPPHGSATHQHWISACMCTEMQRTRACANICTHHTRGCTPHAMAQEPHSVLLMWAREAPKSECGPRCCSRSLWPGWLSSFEHLQSLLVSLCF